MFAAQGLLQPTSKPPANVAESLVSAIVPLFLALAASSRMLRPYKLEGGLLLHVAVEANMTTRKHWIFLLLQSVGDDVCDFNIFSFVKIG